MIGLPTGTSSSQPADSPLINILVVGYGFHALVASLVGSIHAAVLYLVMRADIVQTTTPSDDRRV